MPDQITAAGLELKTFPEIRDEVSQGLQAVYGIDINIDQNSPDGQLVSIFSQGGADLREVIFGVYNSFSPDNAFGVILDQRVALNGLVRKAGTYTTIQIDVTVDRAVTLAGLDAAINDPDGTGFTVADNAGNRFILTATTVFVAAGTQTLTFRAEKIGVIQTIPSTITTVVTVTLGVTGVTNPNPPLQEGENEESDVDLKIRRLRSFELAATGPADAILAALLANTDVVDAFVAENVENTTEDTIPPHSIWCIVDGGSDQDVADIIYSKKGAGCGMKGSVSQVVNKANGQTATMKFDRPVAENLWIEFTITPKKAGVTFDTTLIKERLVAALTFRIAQAANIGDVIVKMLELEPDGILSDVGVSNDDVTYVQILNTSTFQRRFALATTRINITV